MLAERNDRALTASGRRHVRPRDLAGEPAPGCGTPGAFASTGA
jgi:hypothetical protein